MKEWIDKPTAPKHNALPTLWGGDGIINIFMADMTTQDDLLS